MREALSRTFAANLLPTGSTPKAEAPDPSRLTEEDRGPPLVGATGFEPATTCTPSKCATRLRYAPAKPRRDGVKKRRGRGKYHPPCAGVNERRSYAPLDEFSALFSTCEGRKGSTRRALISISCPVCGVPPTRDF